jgi:SAM-dependent methyltransferase
MGQGLGNHGERQTAHPDGFGYFAHLSIYAYALAHCGAGPFVDVGCGTGYGCDYVHRHGVAEVFGFEREAHVVETLRCDRPGIKFDTCDLNEGRLPFVPGSLPFVFSSNVMEHVAYPDAALAACAQALSPGGQAVFAVPPISSIGEVRENAKNVFHITNLPHWCWRAKLLRFFEDVQLLRHWFVSEDRIPDGVRSIIGLSPNAEPIVTLLEDFTIGPPPSSGLEPTMTAVFHCSRPRETFLPFSATETPPLEWRVLQVESEGRQQRYVEQEEAIAGGALRHNAKMVELGAWIDQNQTDGVSAEAILTAVKNYIRS